MYMMQPHTATQYAPPQYAMGNVPAMNNYPIVNQPMNTTQSGISFDQLRSDLMNRVTQLAQSDILANTLYQACAGPNMNFMTGKLDQLVSTLQITVDFMWRQNPQQDINTTYNQALDEVYGCAWAKIGVMSPHLLNDASVQSRRQLINQWNSVADQRATQFQQAGLLTNNPVQTTHAWQTPSFQQGMPMNTQVGMQSQYYNRPPVQGFNTPSATMGMPMQQQMGYQQPMQHATSNQLGSNFTTMNQRPTQQYSSASLNSSSSQEDRKAAYRRRHAEKMKTWTGKVDQWGHPIPGTENEGTAPSQFSEVSANIQPVSKQQVANWSAERLKEREAQFDAAQAAKQTTVPYADTLGGINQVPEKPSLFPKQPYEVIQGQMDKSNSAVIEYGQEQLIPNQENTPARMDLKQVFLNAGIPEETIREAGSRAIKVDLNNQDQVTALFGEMLRQEDQQNPEGTVGLLEDEERCLSDKERRQLYNRGALFEQPYTTPITANPNRNALHAVLLKDGSVRQIITPLDSGVPMRLPAHQDILAPLRNNRSVKNDPNRNKILRGTLETTTTIGGVVYDRFKVSKSVLLEGIKLALECEDALERDTLITQAFRQFDNQVKSDLFEDNSGRGEFLARNPELEEDGFTHPIFDDEEENKRRAAQNELFVKAITVEDTQVVEGGITDSDTILALEGLVNNEPVTADRAVKAVFKQTKVLHTFNNRAEKDLVDEELKDFYWLESSDTEEERERLCGLHYAELLNTRREYIPTFLWERLNNRLTEYTNDALRFIVGIDRGIRIDSFAEDYVDLINHLRDNYIDNPRYPNLSVGIGTMDAFISIAARCLHVTDDYKLTIGDAEAPFNLMDVRTITAVEHHNILHVPALSSTLGVNGNIVSVTEETDGGLYMLLKEMLVHQLSSRVSRLRYKHPITSTMVKFADGNLYRVFPRIGDQQNYHTRLEQNEDAEFYTTLTLVRVPSYL